MTAILSIQNNTIYFEGFIREQLKTQENEARAELKNREVEMQGMQKNLESIKAQKTMNDRIVEELRPLCEELPPDALDPVTYEPFEIPVVYRCGHVFDKKTVKSMIDISDPSRQGDLDCPICKLTSGRIQLLQCIPLEGLVQNAQAVKKIFKENTENEPT